MKKRVAVITVAASAAMFASAGPAQASDAVICGFEATLAYEDGGQDEFRSTQGSVDCAGHQDGRTVIGTGSVSIDGHAGSEWMQSCTLSSGRGSIEISVPRLMPIFDPDPADTFGGTFEFRRAARAWEATGSVTGPGGESDLVAAALEQTKSGDCITGDLATSTLRGRLLIGGDSAGAEAADELACANHVAGTRKRDRLNGTAGSDLVSGFAGDDRLGGSIESDCLFGGGGADRLSGGPGADSIDCGPGRDIVRADSSDFVAANCEAVRSH